MPRMSFSYLLRFTFDIDVCICGFQGTSFAGLSGPFLFNEYCPLLNPMGLSGLEPPTSRLSGVRSNRLSYKPSALFTFRLPFRCLHLNWR